VVMAKTAHVGDVVYALAGRGSVRRVATVGCSPDRS
jgi:hypothetical protein